MEWTGLNELREKYLSFFESKGHLRLPSFSLVPQGDKSLLLINAGMAPLKKYFTGELTPPRKRVTTCQKCIRTPDIERVGITARHGTFFEMLGNFSFGDYFKREATAWAWEFCTKVLEMPADKIYISVYEEDDEAYDIWTKELGIAPDHMVRLGKEDNFWEHGGRSLRPLLGAIFRPRREVRLRLSDLRESAATATDMLSSGTSFSLSSTMTETITIPASRAAISTPVWVLSALPA